MLLNLDEINELREILIASIALSGDVDRVICVHCQTIYEQGAVCWCQADD